MTVGVRSSRQELDFAFLFVVDVLKQESYMLIPGNRRHRLARRGVPVPVPHRISERKPTKHFAVLRFAVWLAGRLGEGELAIYLHTGEYRGTRGTVRVLWVGSLPTAGGRELALAKAAFATAAGPMQVGRCVSQEYSRSTCASMLADGHTLEYQQ